MLKTLFERPESLYERASQWNMLANIHCKQGRGGDWMRQYRCEDRRNEFIKRFIEACKN